MSRIRWVSQLDRDGYFLHATPAHESPLEPGVWHIPGGAVDLPAPDVPPGARVRCVRGQWKTVAIPAEPTAETEPTAPLQDGPSGGQSPAVEAGLMAQTRHDLDRAAIRALIDLALDVRDARDRIRRIDEDIRRLDGDTNADITDGQYPGVAPSAG